MGAESQVQPLNAARLTQGGLAVFGTGRGGVHWAGLSHTKETSKQASKQAYPPWPHSVCLPEGLAGGCAPSDPGVSGPPRERRAARCSNPRTPSRGPRPSVAPSWPTTRPT